MKLNHVNLAVPDVQASRAFFEKYFDFQSIAAPESNTLTVMRGEDGLILTLSNFQHTTEVHYPEGFHIGFIQDSPDRVDAINARLKADGYDVEDPHKFHGSWTFYFRAPGGVLIEVLA